MLSLDIMHRQAQIGIRSLSTGAKNRTGDRLSAFETMIAHDWDRFWRYAYRLCGNRDDAEDLLSESLVDAFRSFGQFRGEGFDRWVFRIMANNHIDMARRARMRRAESLETGFEQEDGSSRERDFVDTTRNPEERLMDPLFDEEVQKALDALPPDFRTALLLCDVEQMEYQEVATTLGLPIGTVRSRIHRARSQMRDALSDRGCR